MDIWTWFNTQSANALTAFQSVMTVVTLFVAAWVSSRGGWTIVKIIMAGIGAALVLFFVWGGHLWLRDVFQATFQS